MPPSVEVGGVGRLGKLPSPRDGIPPTPPDSNPGTGAGALADDGVGMAARIRASRVAMNPISELATASIVRCSVCS